MKITYKNTYKKSLREAVKMARSGMPHQQIADNLNAMGLTNRRGQPWKVCAASAMIRRAGGFTMFPRNKKAQPARKETAQPAVKETQVSIIDSALLSAFGIDRWDLMREVAVCDALPMKTRIALNVMMFGSGVNG